MFRIIFPDKPRFTEIGSYDFETYEQLVNYLSLYNTETMCMGAWVVDNWVLRRCITGQNSVYWRNGEYNARDIRIEEIGGGSVYSTGFKKDVLSWEFDDRIEIARQEALTKLRHRLRMERKFRGSNCPEFRKGPVPKTGGWGCARAYRHPRSIGALRELEACEYARKRFVPTVYDDFVRSKWGSHSWKDATKDKRQWEHGVRNKVPRRGRGLGVAKEPEWMVKELEELGAGLGVPVR